MANLTAEAGTECAQNRGDSDSPPDLRFGCSECAAGVESLAYDRRAINREDAIFVPSDDSRDSNLGLASATSLGQSISTELKFEECNRRQPVIPSFDQNRQSKRF